ncbi:MAG TPA: hypothetical protein VNU19_07035 [Candidatus Acidoferrum sp.]|nr:hypothetical protein [Candidatus Acidoferrum sp.]
MSVDYNEIANQINRANLGGKPLLTGAMVQTATTSAGLVDNSMDTAQLATARAENADLKNMLDRVQRALAAANAKLDAIQKDAS